MSVASVERVISFGPFRLHPERRLLLEGNRPLRLGSRALDILIALVEHAGELVSKDELMTRAWPNTTVEESNLKVHISALRRALADGQDGNRYILTVPGRGYRFSAPLTTMRSTSAVPPPSVTRPHNLPVMVTRLVGRADNIRKLTRLLPQQRFVTIVGTGGVGTTSVALAVAEALLTAYKDGVWLIDLAPLADPGLVLTALATALELELRADDLLPALLAAIRERQMLLVLDNCEHVIGSAADLAVAIRRDAPGVDILATSREPLRARGEHVHRLQPLVSPPTGIRLTAAEALAFPAVQLFVERAGASLGEFELSDEDVPFVVDICTKLDGVPLAIEFAAARVDAFGVRDLASRLDDRLRLLTFGRRTALPRHQTMKATLDWSYDVLPELERLVLHRLGIFAGAFSLEAATAVVKSDEVPESEVADCIANLVAKSLVTADVGGSVVLYRLLETTRAYAREKLAARGNLQQFSRRHAEHCHDLCDLAAAEWSARPIAESLSDCRRLIDEVRVALDWAFSSSGDVSVGVALTIAAAPLWFQLSLMAEARGRVGRALSSIEPSQDQRREMQLQAALGASLLYTKGESGVIGAWTKALELADALADAEYQLRALWGLWVYRITRGDYRDALALAQRFLGIAAGEAGAPEIAIGNRLVGAIQHYMGNQFEARRHLEDMLNNYDADISRSHIVRFQLDQRVAARTSLARILWLQGFPEQAASTAKSTVEDARALDHPLSLCYALALGSCPVALFEGDLATMEQSVAMLLEHSMRHGLTYWQARGRSFKAALAMRRGDVAIGLQLFETARDDFREIPYAMSYVILLAELAQSLDRLGHAARGLVAIDEAIDQCGRIEAGWCTAELLRIKGDLVLLESSGMAVPTAESLFAESLAWARRQGALSWELRTSISLARLRRSQGQTREAHDLLASTYDRFTEGFETVDLLTATRLIRELDQGVNS